MSTLLFGIGGGLINGSMGSYDRLRGYLRNDEDVAYWKAKGMDIIEPNTQKATEIDATQIKI